MHFTIIAGHGGMKQRGFIHFGENGAEDRHLPFSAHDGAAAELKRQFVAGEEWDIEAATKAAYEAADSRVGDDFSCEIYAEQ